MEKNCYKKIYLVFIVILCFLFSSFQENQVVFGLDNTQALKEAKSLLSYSAKSRGGLISYLVRKGFSQSEAEYAADNCDADWAEQALKESISVLSYSPKSKDGLINYLKRQEFTQSEAEYAADHCGADWSKQALKEAISVLTYSSKSKTGLINYLKRQDYTQAEAEYAAENCDADWSKQALKEAESVLTYSAKSKTGLLNYLKRQDFTQEEAEYAVENCNADWNQQALKEANSVLRYSSKSRSDLINYLKRQDFTQEEAEYAAAHCDAEWNTQLPDISNDIETSKNAEIIIQNETSVGEDNNEVVQSIFDYIILQDGTIEITGLNNTEGDNIVIPKLIDGYIVSSIGSKAFAMNDEIINVDISDGILQIGDKAFALCENLTTVSIPDSVNTINDNAFASSTNVELIVSDSSYAKKYAEKNKISYTVNSSVDYFEVTQSDDGLLEIIGFANDEIPEDFELNIPSNINGSNVISIGNKAFALNENIVSVTIPSTVSTIKNKAFSLCENLQKITIPSSVVSIANDAFIGCDNLTMIVSQGSYAESFALENGISYLYPDGNSPEIRNETDQTAQNPEMNKDENASITTTEDAPIENSDNTYVYLFDTFIGKNKDYVKENADQFTENNDNYIIYTSDSDDLNDWVEVIFNTDNEVEYLVWNRGKVLDPSETNDYLEATIMAPLRLGLFGTHEPEKIGSEINKKMAVTYKDNIVCLYDFEKDFTAKCGLSGSFSESEILLADNMWKISYYVDEFGLPGKNGYIYNSKDLTGTFNNSATSKSTLDAALLVDKDDISIILFEYGRSKVKNSSTRNNDSYKIIMLDSQNNRTTLSGTMYTGGDRIFVNFLDKNKVLNALMENGSVSFYIENNSRPTTNYTFSIPANNGFSTAYKLLMGESISENKLATSESIDVISDTFSNSTAGSVDVNVRIINNPNDIGALLRVKASLNGEIMQTLRNGTQVTYLGNKMQADGYTWLNVQTNNGYTGWILENHLKSAE